jgi:hypothetical protein
MEEFFGGYITNVKRNKVSELAPKDVKLKLGGYSGGDRMSRHGYAKWYAKHLTKFVENRNHPYVIVECGILKGTGLAVWSKLFPNATIIGLDIDLSHTKNNFEFLKSKGAFPNNQIELYEFDQFNKNKDLLLDILKRRKVDIVIDDGFHSEETITNTLNDLIPFLSKDFVYFVEDNRTIHKTIVKKYNQYKVSKYKKFVVLQHK